MKTISPKASEQLENTAEKLIWQGMQEGKKEGIKEGIEKGIRRGIMKIVKQMLKSGASDELILKFTDLTQKQLDELKKEIEGEF